MPSSPKRPETPALDRATVRGPRRENATLGRVRLQRARPSSAYEIPPPADPRDRRRER